MKIFAIATLPGLFLIASAFASSPDCAQQISSNVSKAATSYIYVNRLPTPASHSDRRATTAGQQLSQQL